MTTQIVVPVTIDKKPYHAVIELSEIPLAFRCVFCRTDSQIGLANIACNVRLLKLTHASGERVQRTLSSDSYQIAAVRLDDTIERKGPVCAECFGSKFPLHLLSDPARNID